jgi:hypothetical protein
MAHRTNDSVKTSADALHESGNASRVALQELARAYQDLATRSAKTLTDAIQRLSAVKSAAEFIDLQEKQIKDGVLEALSGSQRIAKLTATVITAAFEPTKKQVEAVQKIA